MTNDEMKNLQFGDVVQSKIYGLGYIVTANYGSHITAIRTVDITNPIEWYLIRKICPADAVNEEESPAP